MAREEFAVVWRSSAVNSFSYGRWFADFMGVMGERRSEALESLAIFKSQVQKGSQGGSTCFAFIIGIVFFIPGTTSGFSDSDKSL